MTRATLLAALLASASLPATAANFVSNGSFESGLSGWTLSGGNLTNFPPVAIFYGAGQAYPGGAFGEAVPASNALTNSPDVVGGRAAYFVSDFAGPHTLSQTVALTAGTYQIGFSYYAPANGFANAGEATFAGIIAGLTLVNAAVSAGPATTWRAFQGVANIAADGNYLVEFVFNTNFNPSKDVVIDQVYIIAGNPPPPGVPAPAALALFGIGLMGLGLLRRR